MYGREGLIFRWDLTAPLDAEPMIWKNDRPWYGSFDNKKRWFALSDALYNYGPPQVYTFRASVPDHNHASPIFFTADSKLLEAHVTSSN